MRSCVAHYKTESGNNCTATEITQCSGSMTLIDFNQISIIKDYLNLWRLCDRYQISLKI